MKCNTKRIVHWEIWRSKRLLYVFAAALIICITFRNMTKDTVLNSEMDISNQESIREVTTTPMIYKSIQKKTRKTVVLLVANQRSGSTFVGEMFNQNPNAFYLFEPLFPFSKHCEDLEMERVALINDLLQCNFDSMKKSYVHAFQTTKFTDKDAECLKNNICFETSHQPLLQKYAQICLADDENNHKPEQIKFDPDSKRCGFPLNVTYLEILCKASDIIAYKVIRLCSLKNIELIYQKLKNRGIDLFVIHLVRDPRAVLSSRVSLKVDGIRLHNATSETNEICERYSRNIKYITKLEADHTPNIISDGRYLRVRHEDFTMDPYESANEIYKFIGKQLSIEVRHFISKSHQSMDRILDRIRREDEKAIREKKEIQNYTKSKEILHQMNNPFGTTRDEKEVLTKWRTILPFSVVQLVQDKCKEIFGKLGYKMFNSKLDMINLTLSYF